MTEKPVLVYTEVEQGDTDKNRVAKTERQDGRVQEPGRSQRRRHGRERSVVRELVVRMKPSTIEERLGS